jgi:hypothetical protein
VAILYFARIVILLFHRIMAECMLDSSYDHRNDGENSSSDVFVNKETQTEQSTIAADLQARIKDR